MIEQKDARWWHLMNGAMRWALWNGAAPWAYYPAINEYPKSGGSWLSQLLGEAFELPNPRNRLPLLRSSILHGHHLKLLNPNNIVMVWRDGRDITISFYHHLISNNNFVTPSGQDHARRVCGVIDPEDIDTNLPRFIEAMATGKLTPGFGWQQFVEKWYEHPSVIANTKYEDMLKDTAAELQKIMDKFGKPISHTRSKEIEEKFAFKNQSKREPGQEDRTSFLRKGISGDWKNNFNQESHQVFDYYYGDALNKLGYKK